MYSFRRMFFSIFVVFLFFWTVGGCWCVVSSRVKAAFYGKLGGGVGQSALFF